MLDEMASQPPPKGIYVPVRSLFLNFRARRQSCDLLILSHMTQVPTFFNNTPNSSLAPAIASLDLTTQCDHALFLARSGIRGIVLLGSTGEAVDSSHECIALLAWNDFCGI